MKHYLILFCCLALFSCEKVVEFDYQTEQKICLNCILNPDSTVNLSLHYTRTLDETGEFEPVKDALIEFFEDGELWGTAINGTGGSYSLEKKPLIGKTYSLKVNLHESPALTAETTVQEKPGITYLVQSREKYFRWRDVDKSTHFYNLVVDYQLNDQAGKDYYWNYFLGWNSFKKKYTYGSWQAYISPYIDDFNRVIEPDSKYGFYYEYYVRLTDTGVDGGQLSFRKDMTTRRIDVFFNADEHYDKYMKSSIQQKMIDDQDLPFKEPVQIYSNIENGTGIFGSASFTYLSFRNE